MIEARSLTKRYGDTVAVNDLSFTVSPGRVTGFLGPNGSGKSTAMRVILGLDAPTSGDALVNGQSYRQHTLPMNEVGALLDPTAVHPGRSAYNHLLWLAQAGGVSRNRVGQVLELVGLGEAGHRQIGQFSLGMRQRLGIAAAMLGDPKVLMLDEPLNGLDPEGILWMRNLLKDLASQGRTVFLSSHLMNEMEATADHVLVIGAGKLIADVSVAELVSSGTHVDVVSPHAAKLTALLQEAGAEVQDKAEGRLTVTGMKAPQIGELAAAQGISLHELTPASSRLEEAFISLTHDQGRHQGQAINDVKEYQGP